MVVALHRMVSPRILHSSRLEIQYRLLVLKWSVEKGSFGTLSNIILSGLSVGWALPAASSRMVEWEVLEEIGSGGRGAMYGAL